MGGTGNCTRCDNELQIFVTNGIMKLEAKKNSPNPSTTDSSDSIFVHAQ